MRCVVVTTINKPTELMNYLSKNPTLKTVVIGDRKTPSPWEHDKVDYFSYDKQLKLNFNLVKLIPSNHYSRKNIGYLIAIKMGASEIIDIDDDNYPTHVWDFPNFYGEYSIVHTKHNKFINIYRLFSKKRIWPRGFPINLINNSFNDKLLILNRNVQVGIWQGLANGDPDVDAIYRLTNDEEVIFNERSPVVLETGFYSTFNSQNTITRRELFPLLYLPITVTFRYTDILRSLVAQPIMHLFGYKLGYVSANVYQHRNHHDLLQDFISEIPMYLNNNIVDIVNAVISKDFSISENLLKVYTRLFELNVVLNEEVRTLTAWLDDLSEIYDHNQ